MQTVKRLLDSLPDDLRRRALTHPAFVERRASSFERLEFLGDTVLGLAMADEACRRFPDLAEGALSQLVNAVVSRRTCAAVADECGLGQAMVEHVATLDVPNGAEAQQLALQRNTRAALVESVLGAGFLAFGFDVVAPHAVAAFDRHIDAASRDRGDAKSRLQELAAREQLLPRYEEIERSGPPHDMRFTISAQLVAAVPADASDAADLVDGDDAAAHDAGELRAHGTGRSKQEAQQEAAAALLDLMDAGQG